MDNDLSKKNIGKALNKKKSEAEAVLKDSKKTEGLLKKTLNVVEKAPGVGKYVNEIRYMCAMIRDYVKKEYTDVKLSTMITIAASLVYLVSPVDIIPDYIPVVGYLDDMAVLAYAIRVTHKEIEAYRLWRNLKNLKMDNAVEENFDDIGVSSAPIDDTEDSDDVQFDTEGNFEQVISNGNDDCDETAFDDGL